MAFCAETPVEKSKGALADAASNVVSSDGDMAKSNIGSVLLPFQQDGGPPGGFCTPALFAPKKNGKQGFAIVVPLKPGVHEL